MPYELVLSSTPKPNKWLLYWESLSLVHVFAVAVLIAVIIAAIHFWDLWPWSLALRFLNNVLDPNLRALYRSGPHFSVAGVELGFWHSASLEDICSRMAGQSSAFWRKNLDECHELYLRKENAFCIIVESVIGLLFGYKMARVLVMMVLSSIFPRSTNVIKEL